LKARETVRLSDR